MINGKAQTILERIAESVLLIDVDDKAALAALDNELYALAEEEPTIIQQPFSLLLECKEVLNKIIDGSCDDISAAMDLISKNVSLLQQGIYSSEAVSQKLNTMPEWVDEDIFAEFLTSAPARLDELESAILSLEKGNHDAVSFIRGRIHTLKGEAGMLNLAEIERSCHIIEDLLSIEIAPDKCIDLLLIFKDRLGEILNEIKEGKLTRDNSDILKEKLQLIIHSNNLSNIQKADEQNVQLQETATRSSVIAEELSTSVESTSYSDFVWDDDTIDVAEEFLHESNEGLLKVDEILLEIENGGSDLEKVNALFRVFHTIKGVAGFLSLDRTTKLAHASETLLNKAREETLELDGTALDLLFESTQAMREMMGTLREAVSERRAPTHMPDATSIVVRLLDLAEGRNSKDKIEEAQYDSKCTDDNLSEGGNQTEQKPDDTPQQVNVGKDKIKEVVKIELERVDNLVGLIGELVIVESMVANAPAITRIADSQVQAQISQLSKLTRDLQDISTRMRMVPVRGVFQKMARMVRDVSRSHGKKIRTMLSGEGTEMDRSMVEQIADPLIHMIRNSVDHGIETPEERKLAGKSQEGTISIKAYHQGGNVVIELSDDGRGLNRDRILQKALEKGLISDKDQLSDHDIYNLIFLPGFSTAPKVTEISGRGVGMDVVRRNIEAMRGKVRIDSVFGKGTTFHMMLPLTLAIIDGMLVVCGEERYILPSLSVLELIKPDRSMLFTAQGDRQVARIREEIIPIFRLDTILNIQGAISDSAEGLIVLLESQGRKVGLIVDDVLAQQQVVIKGMGNGMDEARHLSGSAILSDGRVGLILNPDELFSISDRTAGFAYDGNRLPNTGVSSQRRLVTEKNVEKQQGASP